MKISGYLPKVSLICTALSIPLAARSVTTIMPARQDTFTKTQVSAKGTEDKSVLFGAPSAKLNIMGEEKFAKIVVDTETNVLYKYDEKGNAQIAYLVASGKKNTPTDKGVRIVTHTESYPYASAPEKTRRRNHPKDYGPRIICLNKLNTETGEQSPIGEFIHGNNNPSSIGKYVSLGCIRMDNEVIKELANEIKKGDIVIIK